MPPNFEIKDIGKHQDLKNTPKQNKADDIDFSISLYCMESILKPSCTVVWLVLLHCRLCVGKVVLLCI